jgi:hypothetical protein
LTERETIRWKQTERSETFELFVFLLPENTLHKNQECFVSHGERVYDAGLKLAKVDEKVNGERHYFVAITGDYVDAHVSDARGQLGVPTAANVKEILSNTQKLLWEEEGEDEYITL